MAWRDSRTMVAAVTMFSLLRQETPQSAIMAIGFSLSGNVLLKWAGESAMAAYERRFVRLLKAAVSARQALFSDAVPVIWPKRLTLYEFDNLYTAPQGGFRDADEYYARCSAAPLAPRIALPCRILFAADDPLVDVRVFDRVTLPPNVQVYYTDRGGHLGFLGIPGLPGGYRWLDAQLLAWIENPATVPFPQLDADGNGH